MRLPSHCLLFGLLAQIASSPAQAQDETAGATKDPAAQISPDVALPVLLEPCEPNYPLEELASARVEWVTLRLHLDVDGRVTDAEIVESPGPAFDAPARATALLLRFEPARREGLRIASRILYRMTFEPPPSEPSTERAPVEDGSLSRKAPTSLEVSTSEAAAPPAEPLEVFVQGERSEGERLQNSAEAVTVIDTTKAKRQTADLGEVLARSQGVGVRRSGGLGSASSISLGGLDGDQIRMFVDGVPMERAGYPFELANVPVNLVDRVEIYRGVVPIRFGADALGGAINVVTDQDYHPHVGVSYQHGSFGVHRAAINARYRNYPTGFVSGGALFVDIAENNYEMSDRLLPQPDGSSVTQSVDRFHDAYSAFGGHVEIGLVERPWARKLLLQAFTATYKKELQHNSIMSIPYGEVTYDERTYGGTLRYEVEPRDDIELEILANYAFRDLGIRDLSTHVYRWTGEPGREVGREVGPGQPARGEVDGSAVDQSIYEHSVYGRAGLAWTIKPAHITRLSLTPQLAYRTGDDHVPGRVDLLQLDDSLRKVVGGAEYELNLFNDRLQNIAFGKFYMMRVTHEGRSERNINQEIYETKETMVYGGGGDALRFRLTDWLLVKTSYEYAIRLPRVEELFGDGALVTSNASLKPERSHNMNLGPRFDVRDTPIGRVVFDSNLFLREVKDLIVLLAGQQFVPYSNIGDVRVIGVENALTWDSPRRYVGLSGTLTYQDFRNRTKTGVFEPMYGMRVPNRPYFFASWGATGRVADLFVKQDTLEPFYQGRYVHSFDRAWKIGDPDLKPTLPSQISHALGVTYSLWGVWGNFAGTFEVDNLTNAQLYDYYGVQRPGRSFNLKLTAEL